MSFNPYSGYAARLGVASPYAPGSAQDQLWAAQRQQQAAAGMAPTTSPLAAMMNGVSGYLGGRQEAQAQGAVDQQRSALAAALRSRSAGGPSIASLDDQLGGGLQMQTAAAKNYGGASGATAALQGIGGLLGGRQEAEARSQLDALGVPPADPSKSSGGLLGALGLGSSPEASSPSGGLGRKSDRRLKSQVARIAIARNGLAIYRYRLAGENGWHVGMMADEVALIHPDAVWTDSDDGWARVDYSKAVL